ncbi:MAG: hypothetical protein WCT12_09930 [Verrucomicrobiota bacterium]
MSSTNIIQALPLPPVYYSQQGPSYWVEDARGKWIKINETSAKITIRTNGYGDQKSDDVSECDRCLLDIQSQQNVAYAGALAGYRAGPYSINNNSVLVTESPRLIQPASGDWPTLHTIFEGMFCDQEYRQLDYLYGWLKMAIDAVYSSTGSPGQALVMAGPVNSAKSLSQGLITEILGGRSAKPYLYMTGGTTFNGDLFRAEHLMIEDDAEHISMEARREFAASIKSISVNRDQHCHGKNKEALTLTPIWRLSISLNDEPQRLLVLPNLDSDIADKMIILKARCCPMPMPTETPAQRDAFWLRLKSELPHFIHFLQHWQIPDDLRSPRFGIIHFHHPDIATALFRASPENRLLEIIDQSLFDGYNSDPELNAGKPFEGTSRKVEKKLFEGRMEDDARKLLKYAGSCGTYLGKLQRSPDAHERIQSRTVRGDTVWTIYPPPKDT